MFGSEISLLCFFFKKKVRPFQRNVLLKDKIAALQSSFKPLEEIGEEVIHTPYACKYANPNQKCVWCLLFTPFCIIVT